MNINIRYGHMTMALLAQTVIHQFRERLGAPFATWDAKHLSSEVFRGLVGDLRVRENRAPCHLLQRPEQGTTPGPVPGPAGPSSGPRASIPTSRGFMDSNSTSASGRLGRLPKVKSIGCNRPSA